MSLLKNLSLMSFSTVVRLGAAVLAVSITARALGPQSFGVLMFWLSVATLLGMACNFGLASFLLREIGRDPEAAPTVFGSALSARLILTGGVLAGSLIALPLLGEASRWVFVLLLLTMLAEGFTDFMNVGFRARGRFDVEARLSLLAASIYGISVAGAAWFTHSVQVIAAAYFVSRLLILGVTWRRLHHVLGPLQLQSPASGWARLKSSVSYAVDYGLSTIFGQIDSLVLNFYLSPAAVGIHQAGMRLFMAGASATPVLANVFLPRASAAHGRGAEARATEDGRVQLAFLGVGALVGIAMALVGGWAVRLLFGPGFDALAPLMPWFGLLLAVRFSVAAWGILLTARGLQHYRATANLIHWIVVAAATTLLVPRYGNLGWLLSLITGHAVLFALYVGRIGQRSSRDVRTLGLTALMLMAFLPVLYWH